MINDSLFAKITAIYERRRSQASERAFYLRSKAESTPAFAKNSQKLKEVGFLKQKSEYEGEKDNAEKYAVEFARLKDERKRILADLGLDESDLSVKYHCPKCEDTGFLPGGGTCECFYSTMNAVINDFFGINERKLHSFDSYEVDDKTDDSLKTKLINYCEKFPDMKKRNLIFTGTTGSGKTFSAECIADALVKSKKDVIFLTAVKANDLLFHYHTSNQADKKAVFELLTACDLLIIDDLGTEPILKNVTVEYLTAIISERIANKKPFIITTNLNPGELSQRYTERLLSRLSGEDTLIIPFAGRDKRRKNLG